MSHIFVHAKRAARGADFIFATGVWRKSVPSLGVTYICARSACYKVRRPYFCHRGVTKVRTIANCGCKACTHSFSFKIHPSRSPCRFLAKQLRPVTASHSPAQAGQVWAQAERVTHPCMLIIIYFQSRIETWSAANNGMKTHSADRPETRSTKCSTEKTCSTKTENPFHERPKAFAS